MAYFLIQIVFSVLLDRKKSTKRKTENKKIVFGPVAIVVMATFILIKVKICTKYNRRHKFIMIHIHKIN